jgi:hypothetical protein
LAVSFESLDPFVMFPSAPKTITKLNRIISKIFEKSSILLQRKLDQKLCCF